MTPISGLRRTCVAQSQVMQLGLPNMPLCRCAWACHWTPLVSPEATMANSSNVVGWHAAVPPEVPVVRGLVR